MDWASPSFISSVLYVWQITDTTPLLKEKKLKQMFKRVTCNTGPAYSIHNKCQKQAKFQQTRHVGIIGQFARPI